MKEKNWVVRLAICLLATLLAAPCALADLSRGSRGEDVRRLQSMLIDLGFLNDAADGIFGKKTQAAVKGIQRYWGLDETGTADDGVINDLELLWNMAMGMERESGAPMDDEGYPPSCSWTEDSYGHADFCSRHIAQYPIAIQLSGGNPPEKLACLLRGRISEIWLAGIRTMYCEWSAQNAEAAAQQLAIFEAALSEKRAVWHAQYGEGTSGALMEEAMWLENIGVDLCFDLYGAEPNR